MIDLGTAVVFVGASIASLVVIVMRRRRGHVDVLEWLGEHHSAVTTRRRTAEPPTRPDHRLAPPAPRIVPWKALAWPCTHVGPGTTDLVRDSLGRAYIVCGECGSTMRFPEADNLQDAPTPQDAR